jgi:hypothetical protein
MRCILFDGGVSSCDSGTTYNFGTDVTVTSDKRVVAGGRIYPPEILNEGLNYFNPFQTINGDGQAFVAQMPSTNASSCDPTGECGIVGEGLGRR